MIDLTRWADRQLLPIMAELGNERLVQNITLLPDLKSCMEFNPALLMLAELHCQTLRGERYYRNPGDVVDEVLACCKLISGGPKLYRPDRETCEGAEVAGIEIPWGQLRLPYPALILQFPEAWAESLQTRTGGRRAIDVALVAEVHPGHFYIQTIYRDGMRRHWKISARPDEFPDVEGYLQAQEVKGRKVAEEYDREVPGAIVGPDANEAAIKRAIFNLCLFLGHFGTKELGWLRPKDRERHQSKKKRDARAKAFALGDIMQVGLSQEIRVFRYTKDRPEPKGDPIGTERKSPRPHYRRGHWAMLNYGPRDHPVKRLKYIRGTRVNWHLFDGNTWENETTFKDEAGVERQ